MDYSNVKLWFAKDEDENIVTINDINEDNKNDKYSCPICGSLLRPKAVKSTQVTSHFAHVDKSKCNSESQIHFWFKHKFLVKGDAFKVISDKEHSYTCKDILVEEPYTVGNAIYKPDVTILTECGNTIYFEMAFTNKKKVKDYLDIWLELKNIVVEVDIKQLLEKDTLPSFKALFYNGKCFDMKKDAYYDIIGKHKEKLLSGKIDEDLKQRIQKLDWLWDDVLRYKKGEVDINYLSTLMDSVDKEDREIMRKIFKKPSCVNIMNDYMENKLDEKYKEISDYVENKYSKESNQYLSKSITHVKEPFVGSWYESKIIIKDLKRCTVQSFDFAYHDHTEQLIKNLNTVIPNNKKVEVYNANAMSLQEKIDNNLNHNEILDYLTDKDDYNFSCEVSDYQYENDDYDIFKVSAVLKYRDRKIKSCTVTKKLQLDSDIDSFIEKLSGKIKRYFEELRPIKSIEELNRFSIQLQNKYKDLDIHIKGGLHFEDVYLISLSNTKRKTNKQRVKNYYVFGDCISYDVFKDEIMTNIENPKQINYYISNAIDKEIKEETRRYCYECDEDFTLELGEIKFFKKKGFDYPNRCKPCRDKRKQERLKEDSN